MCKSLSIPLQSIITPTIMYFTTGIISKCLSILRYYLVNLSDTLIFFWWNTINHQWSYLQTKQSSLRISNPPRIATIQSKNCVTTASKQLQSTVKRIHQLSTHSDFMQLTESDLNCQKKKTKIRLNISKTTVTLTKSTIVQCVSNQY